MRWTVRLRARFVLLVVIVVVPFLFLGGLEICLEFRGAVRQEVADSLERASTAANAISQFVEHVWQWSDIMGPILFERAASLPGDRLDAVLAGIAAGHLPFRHFKLVGPAGEVLYPPDFASQADKEYFLRIKAGANRAVADLSAEQAAGSPATGAPLLALASAVRREGRLVGILVTPVFADDIARALSILPAGRLTIGILNREGRLVYVQPEAGSSTPSTALEFTDEAAVRRALLGRTVTFDRYIYAGDNGTRLGAIVPISEFGWAVVAAARTDSLLAPVRAETFRNALVLALVVGGSLTGASLIASRLIARFQALQQSARSWSREDSGAQAAPAGDELATTAQVLTEMAARLSRLEAERRRLAQVIAHELINPITGIKAGAQLMRAQTERGSGVPRMAEKLKSIEEQAGILAKLIPDALVALSNDAREPLKREPTDLGALAEGVVGTVRARSGHVIAFARETGEGIYVDADPARIAEVLSHLLENACKYSPPGSEVAVTLRRSDGHAEVSVSDQGMGIPADEVPRIFERFYRARNAGSVPGMGIGLAVAREIVERHGGSLTVESEEGRGATFRLQLPLYDGALNSSN